MTLGELNTDETAGNSQLYLHSNDDAGAPS